MVLHGVAWCCGAFHHIKLPWGHGLPKSKRSTWCCYTQRLQEVQRFGRTQLQQQFKGLQIPSVFKFKIKLQKLALGNSAAPASKPDRPNNLKKWGSCESTLYRGFHIEFWRSSKRICKNMSSLTGVAQPQHYRVSAGQGAKTRYPAVRCSQWFQKHSKTTI